MSGILAKKIGMTQIFEDGKFIPVTVIEAGPNYVLQKKTVENDGYSALQLGFDEKREKNTTKPLMGIFNKAGVKPLRLVKELKVDSVEGIELGQEIKVDALAEVAFVDITGTSKGKGTAGVMKRHNFSGNRATHGVSRNHRLGGSIGMSSWPGKVLKNKKMAGQYGNATATVQNLKIVNSLFMAVKDKATKTLDNSLYIGRYIEDTILQKIRLVEKKSGVLECNLFNYSYNRIPISDTCPAPTNWGDSTIRNGQKVCINLDWVGTGPIDPITKECSQGTAYPVADTNGPCHKLMDDCTARPPGSEAYVSVLTMDIGDLYSANIGDFTVDTSVTPPVVPVHIPLEISTAICNYETESPSSPNYTCDLNKLGMIGVEDPPSSGTIPFKLLDHAFYSIKDTEFFSDQRFKTDIKELTKSDVLKLRPRKYDWRMMKTSSIGFIADEMELITPELVGNKKGTKNINLVGLIPQLVFTMKNQKSRLNKLEDEIDSLLNKKLKKKNKRGNR